MARAAARLIQQLLTETRAALRGRARGVGLLIAAWTRRDRHADAARRSSPASAYYDSGLAGARLHGGGALRSSPGLVFGVGPALFAWRAGSGAPAGRTLPTDAAHEDAPARSWPGRSPSSIVLFTGSIALGRAFIALLRRRQRVHQSPAMATMNVSLAGSVRQNEDARPYLRPTSSARVRAGSRRGLGERDTDSLPLATTGFMGPARSTSTARARRCSTFMVPIAPELLPDDGRARARWARLQPIRISCIPANRSPLSTTVSPAASAIPPPPSAGRFTAERRPATQDCRRRYARMRYDPVVRAAEPAGVLPPSRSPRRADDRGAGQRQRARPDRAPSAMRCSRVDPKVPVFNVKTMEERLDDDARAAEVLCRRP